MKLKEYIEALNGLSEDHPELLDMEVIYSSDDEGNNYQKVHNHPCAAQVENIKDWSLEMVGIGEEDVEEANCVIIN